MGLDVYVGSLTRYFSGEWETVVQRYGREQGIPVQIVRTHAEPEDAIRDPERIRPMVLQWRDQLNAGLAANLRAPLDWDESPESSYFTDKPAWDGYGGMVLFAAHDEHPDIPLPATVPDGWAEHPAYQASTAEGHATRYPALLMPEAWLPCDFDFTFKAPLVEGNPISIGSSVMLLEELRELNRRTLKGSIEAMINWRRQGADRTAPLEQAARFALAMFIDLATAAVQNRLPMKLDY